MKHTKLTYCILTACLLSSTLSGVTSSIQHVELYPRGAAITRNVQIEGTDANELQVEIPGFPSTLLASSIQIAPEDGADLRVGGFSFLPNENPVKEDDPRTADLRASIEKIDTSLRLVRLEREAIMAKDSHYVGLAESIRKSLEEEASATTFELAQTAWESLEAVRSKGEQRLADLAATEKQLNLERKTVQEELNKLVNSLNRLAGALQFDLSGNLSGGVRLLVRYQVREANWSPVHEIRAEPATGTVQWIYKARIQQQTGEDWSGVAASLNSASALDASGLPILRPLILQRMEARPLARSMVREKSDAVYELSAFEARAPADQEAVPESTTTGFFIHLPEPLSLKTGESPAVRDAFTGSLTAEFWSEAVPELSTEAWLMAGMTNELGWPILAGESFAYIDGQLVARRHIAGIAAGEEIELPLGRNEKIVIERKERVKKESEGGLIDRTKRHDIKYETTVTNRMPVVHRVILQDRFPIGRDNKIQVRITGPKDVEPEEGTGIFKWERTVQSGAKAVLTTEYSVIYPAEWTIYPPL